MAKRSIRVYLSDQRLDLLEGDRLIGSYPVSTALAGAGEQTGSEKTPRGRHEVRAMVGAGAPRRAVFAGRRPTGEVCSAELVAAQPGRDWILTRILWLRGLEPGKNRLGDVDSMRRYIYIHGTPDEERIGVPVSHGCIRMRNDDVLELFELVETGTVVDILE